MKKILSDVTSFAAAAALLLLIIAPIAAQDTELRPEVIRQIQALSAEKHSRTGAQKKLDSNLLYAIKIERREAIADGINSLETGIKPDGNGYVEVEITAKVTKGLLDELNLLKAEIINSFPEYRSIRAKIQLKSIERLAAHEDVIFIAPPREPVSSEKTKLSDIFFSNGKLSDLATFFNEHSITGQALKTARFRSSISRLLNPDGRPEGGTVTAQGDITHGANIFRTSTGFNGSGVKIGVLSDGVNSLAARQASGDLPQNVTVLPGQAGQGDEGTAMLEIVNDMAPGAQLYFATGFDGLASFANNVRGLRAAGCTIIIDDVSYSNETAFQNGQAANVVSNRNGGLVVQAVNDVTVGPQSGAMYFSSAANSGNKDSGTAGVWEGDFVDGGTIGGIDGQIHNFGTSTINTITQSGGSLVLQWADPLGASANDYDIFVINSAGTTIVGQGANEQSGTQDPVETVPKEVNIAGNKIVVAKYLGASRFLHINSNSGQLTTSTSGVTFGHNAGVNTIGVAATPAGPESQGVVFGPFPNLHSSSNKVEDFSSDGPRRIFFNADGTPITPGNFLATGGSLLQKPDMTAADGVSTTTPNFQPFYGTSAAAPTAGALAALLKSAMPAATNTQIINAMKSTALDIAPAGNDRNSGAGIVMPIPAFQALGGVVVPGVSIKDVSFSEGNAGNKTFDFKLTLSTPSTQIVTVAFSTADGTASAGSDYVSNAGSITFNPNETSKTVTVTVNGDTVIEPTETFFVNLSNPAGATIIDNQGLGTIINDDTGPAPAPSDTDLDPDFISRLVGQSDGITVQSVRDIKIQTDGKFVIGGDFTSFASRPQAYIARLNADGTPDFGFNPTVNGIVHAIALQTDGKIVIGGEFSQVNGLARSRVARLNADGSLDELFENPAVNDTVFALAIQTNDKIMVGGTFDAVAGAPAESLVRLESDGTRDLSFMGPDLFSTDEIYALAILPDGKILAGGHASFGPSFNYLARLFPNGSYDAGFSGIVNDNVNQIKLVSNDKIMVGGRFTRIGPPGAGSLERRGIARFNANGSPDASFRNVSELSVNRIEDFGVQSDGRIVLGGSFTYQLQGGPTQGTVARIESDGTFDLTYSPLFGSASALAIAIQPNDKALIGGNFNVAGAVARNALVRLNTNGSQDLFPKDVSLGDAKNTPLNNSIASLRTIITQPDGKILVGGYFDSASGKKMRGLVRLNLNGTLDEDFQDPGIESFDNVTDGISTLAVDRNGKILVGGVFQTVNGAPRRWLLRLHPNGSLDNTFNPVLNGPVHSIGFLADDTIMIGGDFDFTIGGQSRGGMARLKTDGTLDPTFNKTSSNYDNYALDVLPSGKILAHGSAGQGMSGLARFNPDGSIDPTFTITELGSAQIKRIRRTSDDKIIIVGSLTPVAGQPLRSIARLNSDGTFDANFQEAFFGGSAGYVYDAAVEPNGKVVIVGQFLTVNGQSRRNIARLNADGSLDGNFIAKVDDYAFTGGGNTVYTVWRQQDGRILVGGRFQTINRVGADQIARFNNGNTPACTYSANPPDRTFSSAGGTNNFTVTAPAGCTWSATSNAGWITVTSGGNGTGNGTLNYSIAANTSTTPRTATITVTGQNLTTTVHTITQAGSATCTYAINPTNRNFPVNGGSDNITVTAPAGCAWAAVSNSFAPPEKSEFPRAFFDPARRTDQIKPVSPQSRTEAENTQANFIVISSGSSGTGNGTVNYAVEPNAGAARSGTMTIAGQTFTVTQDAAPTNINVAVQSNPVGRSFTVDGTTYTSTQVLSWVAGSNHIISTTSTQAGTTGTQYVWANWSDAGAISHTVNPSVATSYTVNFTTQHQLTMASGTGGTVSPSTGFINAGQTVNITATPNAGFAFGGWTGTGTGSFTGSTNPVQITVNGPISETASFVQTTVPVTIQTSPAGRSFTVDGVNFSSAQTLNWTPGSIHTIATTSLQPGTTGTQYVFANWSDTGAMSHTVSPSATATFTANFTTQHQLTVSAGTGGTVTPASSFVNAGQPVTITATPNAGFTFAGWTGIGSGSYSGTTNPAQVTPNGPVTQTAAFTPVSQRRAISDFDGDGKSDTAVWRESNGIWFWSNSSDNAFNAFQFGSPGDIIVPGDYDGDRKADLAVYRVASGLWYLQRSRDGFSVTQWGAPEDIPVPGDYDGDGKTDIAVWRPSSGIWFVINSGTGQITATQWGQIGDKLVPGDYDGDGRTDLAVYRVSSGIWFMIQSTAGFSAFQFGIGTDKVVPADYDGDGKTDMAVYRDGPQALWYLQQSTAGFDVKQWGTNPDVPVPGDYDGDGKADIAVWRPSSGIWFFQRSSSGFLAVQFGTQGDKLIPAFTLPSQ